MELLTIGQLAEGSGKAPSAIRYYEEMGLLRPAARVGGHRRFAPSALHRMAVIDLLRVAGFSLREIRQLVSASPRTWRPRTKRKLAEVEQRIERAQMARRILQAALECDCDRLEGCQVAARAGREIRRHRVSTR